MVRLTATLPVAPATVLAGTTAPAVMAPGVMVTADAVAVSMDALPALLVARANVPVAPGTCGLRMPPRVMVFGPASVLDPPVRVTVTVCPDALTTLVPVKGTAPP